MRLQMVSQPAPKTSYCPWLELTHRERYPGESSFFRFCYVGIRVRRQSYLFFRTGRISTLKFLPIATSFHCYSNFFRPRTGHCNARTGAFGARTSGAPFSAWASAPRTYASDARIRAYAAHALAARSRTSE